MKATKLHKKKGVGMVSILYYVEGKWELNYYIQQTLILHGLLTWATFILSRECEVKKDLVNCLK